MEILCLHRDTTVSIIQGDYTQHERVGILVVRHVCENIDYD